MIALGCRSILVISYGKRTQVVRLSLEEDSIEVRLLVLAI